MPPTPIFSTLFFLFLFMFFLMGSRGAFYGVYGLRGVPGGVAFGDIFEKIAFFLETAVPSFLIDPTMIWLDFEGAGLPESKKI